MCGVVRASAVGDRKTNYRIAHLSASPAIESSQIAITRHARRITFSGARVDARRCWTSRELKGSRTGEAKAVAQHRRRLLTALTLFALFWARAKLPATLIQAVVTGRLLVVPVAR